MFEGLRSKVDSFKEKISSSGVAQRARERTLEDALERLTLDLVESDVAYEVAEDLARSLGEELEGEVGLVEGPGAAVDAAIEDVLRRELDVEGPDLDEVVRKGEKPVHVMFVGPNGAGKTTTIAKFAERYGDLEVVVAAGDTFRAGAEEQLAKHAEALGVKLIRHERGADPAAVIYDAVEHSEAAGADLVLSDTAGRLHTKSGLMDQLEKIKRVTDPDIVVFVDEALAGNDAVCRSEEFDEAVGIDGSVLTKVDADTKGGAILSVVAATGKPVLFVGTGQGYQDIKPFDVDWYIEEVLESGS